MSLVEISTPQPRTRVITLNRPERLNAMSIELVIELAAALETCGADNDCSVVILTGAGRAFCSGLDLKDYGVIPNIDGLQVGQIAQRSMRYYSCLVPIMRRMPQPVIAAVNGIAYGGGMCLSLGAELRIGSDTAEFNSTGIVNGLTSTELGASYLLPRLIGAAHSNDILLTGRVVDAEDALRIGLVSRVLPFDDLMPAALEMAARMSRVQPLRPGHDEGRDLGQPRDQQPRRRHRDRGPQPADARLHREPARGHPGLRPEAAARLHRRTPSRPVHARRRRHERPRPSTSTTWRTRSSIPTRPR